MQSLCDPLRKFLLLVLISYLFLLAGIQILDFEHKMIDLFLHLVLILLLNFVMVVFFEDGLGYLVLRWRHVLLGLGV